MQVDVISFGSFDPFFFREVERSLEELFLAALLADLFQTFELDESAEKLKERDLEVKEELNKTEAAAEAVKTAVLPKIEEVEEEAAETLEPEAKSEEKAPESSLDSID